MMNNDLVSIVVPIYKVEKYLEKCITSIINQTYLKIEIILVDDGSPDKCGDICDKYAKQDKRIKVIHQTNIGVSGARNSGIKSSKGKYITFVDPDDYVENNYIEELYNAIVSTSSDICVCGYNIVKNGRVLPCKNKLKNLSFSKNIDYLFDDNKYGGFSWNKLYKKELIKDFQFPLGVRRFQDVLFNIEVFQCSNISKVVYIDKKMYNYVMCETSQTHSPMSIDVFKTKTKIYNKLSELNSKYANSLKLGYLHSYYINKALYSDFNDSEIIDEVIKINKLKTFIGYGKLSTKIKILIIKIFPKLYSRKRNM